MVFSTNFILTKVLVITHQKIRIMKAKSHLNLCVILFLCLFALLFAACEDELDPLMDPINDQLILSKAHPEGSTIAALNNNVLIKFPPGAVEEPVTVKVKECNDGGDCNFLLKMISIEPVMQFAVPVEVTLSYDGELVCNEKTAEECNIVVCHWAREYDYFNRLDYMNRVNVECISCKINSTDKTLTF